LSLAWPVIVAELGWMFMGVVDTLMVGWLAPEAIGAVGLGSILFFTAAVFGMGLLLGLDTFVSQAFGAGELHECHRWLRDGVHLALLATPVLMLVSLGVLEAMPALGLHPTVMSLTRPYVAVLTWSSLPLLLYAAFRRYLQALGIVRPVMITLLLANLVNAGCNWVLIFGRYGFPAMGVAGSAWATVSNAFWLLASPAALAASLASGAMSAIFMARTTLIRLASSVAPGIGNSRAALAMPPSWRWPRLSARLLSF